VESSGDAIIGNYLHYQRRSALEPCLGISEGFIVFHGIGSISAAHTEEEINKFLSAVERVAKKITKFM